MKKFLILVFLFLAARANADATNVTVLSGATVPGPSPITFRATGAEVGALMFSQVTAGSAVVLIERSLDGGATWGTAGDGAAGVPTCGGCVFRARVISLDSTAGAVSVVATVSGAYALVTVP